MIMTEVITIGSNLGQLSYNLNRSQSRGSVQLLQMERAAIHHSQMEVHAMMAMPVLRHAGPEHALVL